MPLLKLHFDEPMFSSESTDPIPPASAAAAHQTSAPNFTREVRVAEHDLDRFGWAELAMYARWMEETEYAFLRSRGLSVSLTDERGRYGFPRTHVEWEILSPARRGDEIRIHLWLGPTDGKQLHYQFGLERKGVPDPQTAEMATGEATAVWEACARGKFQMACARFPAEALPYAIPIPQRVLEQLGLMSQGDAA